MSETAEMSHGSGSDWLREGALGAALTVAIAAVKGVFNAGRREREFEAVKAEVNDLRALRGDVSEIRVQVAEIHGWMKGRFDQ